MTYIKDINAELMDQFLEALESGKYKQGTHRLHTRSDDTMCCLGVATAEIGPQCGVTKLESSEKNRMSVLYQDLEGQEFYLLMPPAITAALGIPEDYIESTGSGDVILVLAEGDPETYENDPNVEGEYNKNGKYLTAVSALNDQGAPFTEIARRIRTTFVVNA